MRKSVLFDFDGTILDSETHWVPASARMFEEMTGRRWSHADQRRFVGKGMRDQHAILTADYGVSHEFEEFMGYVKRHSFPIYDSLAQPMPGVLDLFERLRELDVPMGIASAGHREWIERALRRLKIDGLFDVICTADDVERTKPHPDVYLLAAERIGKQPENCVGIEDSNTGLRALVAAEMTSVAYHTEHNGSHDLSLADHHIGHFAELTHERLEALLA